MYFVQYIVDPHITSKHCSGTTKLTSSAGIVWFLHSPSMYYILYNICIDDPHIMSKHCSGTCTVVLILTSLAGIVMVLSQSNYLSVIVISPACIAVVLAQIKRK